MPSSNAYAANIATRTRSVRPGQANAARPTRIPTMPRMSRIVERLMVRLRAPRCKNHADSPTAPDWNDDCDLFGMANKNRNRKNQPPTGEGKHQSRFRGEPRKLVKRSEVMQAQRGHPELNLGDSAEEAALQDGDRVNPRHPKAGR